MVFKSQIINHEELNFNNNNNLGYCFGGILLVIWIRHILKLCFFVAYHHFLCVSCLIIMLYYQIKAEVP